MQTTTELEYAPLLDAQAPSASPDTSMGASIAPPHTLLASIELAKARWVITALATGSSKMSRHEVTGGDGAGLLQLLRRLRNKAEQRLGTKVSIVTIQEAGIDGFWIHRMLEVNDIESYVVDATSIAVARRFRRVKTDTIDGEGLVRTLAAWKRGEPRVCSMVVVPTLAEEDRRRLTRERKTLIAERIRFTNRVKGLLFAHGIRGFNATRSDRYIRLAELRCADGLPLPPRVMTEVTRALERLELVQKQLFAICKERDACVRDCVEAAPARTLETLKGIGPEIASTLWLEGLYRHFDNRRDVAAYAGLAPSPYQSGDMARDQGISKSGNPRLRSTMVELTWLWLRHQPQSKLSLWFQSRVRSEAGRIRKIMICALARKLLIALWRFTTTGEVPEGAVLKSA
jgi:transposase